MQGRLHRVRLFLWRCTSKEEEELLLSGLGLCPGACLPYVSLLLHQVSPCSPCLSQLKNKRKAPLDLATWVPSPAWCFLQWLTRYLWEDHKKGLKAIVLLSLSNQYYVLTVTQNVAVSGHGLWSLTDPYFSKHLPKTFLKDSGHHPKFMLPTAFPICQAPYLLIDLPACCLPVLLFQLLFNSGTYRSPYLLSLVFKCVCSKHFMTEQKNTDGYSITITIKYHIISKHNNPNK